MAVMTHFKNCLGEILNESFGVLSILLQVFPDASKIGSEMSKNEGDCNVFIGVSEKFDRFLKFFLSPQREKKLTGISFYVVKLLSGCVTAFV